ncbi:hypothetical protein KAJ83_06255 [Marivibrio halodurans]|uniref:Uncharacterized protein n=1 Tax=Marivibrio halodurans TaxID=2039722 RepID=A0A8J7V284_9PROT|nr:hypothetical protein [Marivibrio halodurans]MBP5856602.1 hypothetical protein [Marivibrio halodurans]
MTTGDRAPLPRAEAPDGAPTGHVPSGPRPPVQVMRLARLGAFHQSRLSFMRALMRRMKRDAWRFDRPVWAIDAEGFGHAVYRVRVDGRAYSLVCFSHDLPPESRSDRVIAEAWDATFALFDGAPTAADIARLEANVPRQEAGRVSDRELVLSRANRSVRLFDHVVGRLAEGRQPDRAEIEAVGYLMRTTAVYGNGKFGLADRERVCDRPELAGPFRAEMLAVYLIRAFTVDLAEHLAQARDQNDRRVDGAPGRAARLDPALRRRLGVGNSTGLGMAPFLVTHPQLLHRWIAAREEALARVRALPRAEDGAKTAFHDIVRRARAGVADWRTGDERQAARTADLAADLARLAEWLDEGGLLDGAYPWDALIRRGEDSFTLEGQEMLASLVIEPHGPLVDDLTTRMAADETIGFRIDGALSCGAMRDLIAMHYDWALSIDYAAPGAQDHFWYVSEEKLEPRLGRRRQEPGAELEQPLAVGRDVAALDRDLSVWPPEEPLARFLIERPEHRHVARRVQILADHPYAEIRDNLVADALLPIDLLRCKLSFFGATRFDPRSDRWVRITMYQNAPYPEELADMPADDWAYPPLDGAEDI